MERLMSGSWERSMWRQWKARPAEDDCVRGAAVGSMERRVKMNFADLEAGWPAGFPCGGDEVSTGGFQFPAQAMTSNIFQMNTVVSTLQRFVNTIDTAKDTPDLREKLKATRVHIAPLAKETSEKAQAGQ